MTTAVGSAGQQQEGAVGQSAGSTTTRSCSQHHSTRVRKARVSRYLEAYDPAAGSGKKPNLIASGFQKPVKAFKPNR